MRFVLGGDEPVSPQTRSELEQRQDRFRQEADPAILSRIHRVELHPMLPRPRELPRALREMTTRFDNPLRDWHVGYLSVNDVDIPAELASDLKESVPQSILRDIFRPTTRFDFMLEPQHLLDDPRGEQALAEGKQALVRDPLPTIESGVAAMVRERRRRRRFVARPWQTMLSDDSPREYARVEGVVYREVDEDGEPLDDEET